MTQTIEDRKTMEDRVSLFTDAERSKNIETELALIAPAKQGKFNPLLSFWTEKRKLFLQRAFNRAMA